MISFVIGKILILEAGLMLLPFIISFLYKEDILHKMSYGIVILLLLLSENLQYLVANLWELGVSFTIKEVSRYG